MAESRIKCGIYYARSAIARDNDRRVPHQVDGIEISRHQTTCDARVVA